MPPNCRGSSVPPNRFLGAAEPEVLCITGKWGVGKTYAWNHYLREAQARGQIKLAKYAYVSLFGRNSLDDVRTAIVESTVNSRAAGQKPNLQSFESVLSELKSLARPFAKFAGFVPSAAAYVGSWNRALFLLLRDQIVCIDDLERISSGLDAMNVLGLVANLKEEKSCKVVLLLNRDALSGANKESFEAQLEKVADIIVTFDPTPTAAAEIGINKTTKFHSLLAEKTQALGIVNIRAIKKIETFCRRVEDLLRTYDPRILEQAAHTLALGAYAKFQPDEAPPLEFIKTYNRVTDVIGRDEGKVDEVHLRHKNFLLNYDFGHADEFDCPLIEGVERGFFDEAAVKDRAEAMQKRLSLGDKASAFRQVWGLFHDSFDDNQDAVLDAMVGSVKANVVAILPLMLNQTVSFLKDFGRGDQARELIQFYVDNREEDQDFWNVGSHPFLSGIDDPDLTGAFRKKFTARAIAPDPARSLSTLSRSRARQRVYPPNAVQTASSLVASERRRRAV